MNSSNEVRDSLNLTSPFVFFSSPDTIPGEVYTVLFAQTRDILLRLAGPPIRIKISRIEQELLNLEMQSYYIQVKLLLYMHFENTPYIQ